MFSGRRPRVSTNPEELDYVINLRSNFIERANLSVISVVLDYRKENSAELQADLHVFQRRYNNHEIPNWYLTSFYDFVYFEFRIFGLIDDCKGYVLQENTPAGQLETAIDEVVTSCTVDATACSYVQALKFVILWKLVVEMESTGKFKMPTLPKLLIGAMSQFTSNPNSENTQSLDEYKVTLK